MGKCKMGWPSFLLTVLVLTVSAAASAQAPDYNIGRTPTEEEIRAWDISISPGRKGTSVRERDRSRGRETLCAERMRGMPRTEWEGRVSP
jgi:hypothetical protein